MATDIILHVPGTHPIHGLKSIQIYINLFPDFTGTLEANGVDCGEVNQKTLGWLVNQGLQNTLECTRCGHKWLPRTGMEPKFCPSCNSPYWRKPRRKEMFHPSDITDLVSTCKICGGTICTTDGSAGYCENHGGLETPLTPK